MLFKNSKASIEQCDTYQWATDPCSPLVWLLSHACKRHIRTSTGGLGGFSNSQLHRQKKSKIALEHISPGRFIKNTHWDMYACTHITADRDTQAPLPFHTHPQSLVEWLISSPRSNLTRNSNEIKCHQCDFSPFLLIVLGNGIRATDDQGHGAVNPLPSQCSLSWCVRYLIRGLQFKHKNAIMFLHTVYLYLGGWAHTLVCECWAFNKYQISSNCAVHVWQIWFDLASEFFCCRLGGSFFI